jgi:hypothetical protein
MTSSPAIRMIRRLCAYLFVSLAVLSVAHVTSRRLLDAFEKGGEGCDRLPSERRWRESDTDRPRPTADHIEGLVARVEPAYRDVCRRMLNGEPLTFTQGYQDWWMVHNLRDYRHREWGDGWYLDIGTNHPTDISNTLFFDKCLGWSGVCVEPNEAYHKGIRETRSCELVPHCVLGRTKEVHTEGQGVLFTVMEEGDNDKSTNGEGTVCLGITEVMAGLDVMPERFDVANLDIEGAEGDVLRCFPFDKVQVDHWLVETNKQPQASVDWFFHRHGYDAVTSFGDSTNNGFFLDTLYARRMREEEVPERQRGQFLNVQVDGSVAISDGHEYTMWPAEGVPVMPHVLGPGNGHDWLECTE